MESIRAITEVQPVVMISEKTARIAVVAMSYYIGSRNLVKDCSEEEAAKAEIMVQLAVLTGCLVCGNSDINTFPENGEIPLCGYHQMPAMEVV